MLKLTRKNSQPCQLRHGGRERTPCARAHVGATSQGTETPRLGPYRGRRDPLFTATTTLLHGFRAVHAGGEALPSPEASVRLGGGSPVPLGPGTGRLCRPHRGADAAPGTARPMPLGRPSWSALATPAQSWEQGRERTLRIPSFFPLNISGFWQGRPVLLGSVARTGCIHCTFPNGCLDRETEARQQEDPAREHPQGEVPGSRPPASRSACPCLPLPLPRGEQPLRDLLQGPASSRAAGAGSRRRPSPLGSGLPPRSLRKAAVPLPPHFRLAPLLARHASPRGAEIQVWVNDTSGCPASAQKEARTAAICPPLSRFPFKSPPLPHGGAR